MSSPTGPTGATSDSSPIYNYPIQFLPINPIVPFTKRDGHTFIEALNWLRDWLVDELLPAINNGFQDYAQRVQDAIDALESVMNEARGYADDANDAADRAAATIATIEGLLSDVEAAATAAETSAANAEDARAAAAAIRDATATIRDATITIRDATADIRDDVAAMRDDVQEIADGATSDGVIAGIVANPSSATRAALDIRYGLGGRNAVFVGASNVVSGTWPEALSARFGWTARNFAVGGTGFGHGAPNSFEQQVMQASESSAFANDTVDYVFIAGGGNDIRASYGGTFSADTHRVNACLDLARASFPNARIIVIPSLWGDKGLHPNFWRVTNAIADSARARDIEVIWHAWQWLIGFPTHMADTVHPNELGYDRFVEFISKYLRGESTSVNWTGDVNLASGVQAHANGVSRVTCVDGVVSLEIRGIRSVGNWTHDQDVAQIPLWAAASALTVSGSEHNRAIAGGTNAVDRAAGFFVYPSGMVRIRGIEPSVTERDEFNIPVTMWRIGE